MSGRSDIWIQRLREIDPESRREAIRQLEALGDPAALGALAAVFAADPEPALRSLAQQAGKTIYYGVIKRASESQAASDAERQKAADILAKAQARKLNRR